MGTGVGGAGGSAGEVLRAFLKLGLTSFGGPIAHLGYFREEFVVRRRWIDEGAYADLVALCQFLPGPASSQVGMAIGLARAGLAGALAAWIGFTLPSAIALVVIGLGTERFGTGTGAAAGLLHGLEVGAVAVVATAILGMARRLTPDRGRATLAVAAAAIALAVPGAVGQVGAIAFGAVIGLAFLRDDAPAGPAVRATTVGRSTAVAALVVFAGLLVLLPVVAAATQSRALDLADAFYRAGALVFGGGHVVLPLLEAEVVPRGFVDERLFLAGYGAAQAVPGPLFTFAAYLGTVATAPPNGWVGAAICLVSIFAPSMLLVVGAMPFWEDLRHGRRARSALLGIDAAVVGLLLAAFHRPVWTSGITSAADYASALAGFVLLFLWRVPQWAVVGFCAVVGAVVAL